MKINKITQSDLGIEVELEEYPHAQPVFPADTTKKALPDLLRAWKVEQDAADIANTNPPAPPPEPDIADLKTLEGTTISDLAVASS